MIKAELGSNEANKIRRKRRTKQEIEQALLEAITTIIATHGFQKLTINNVSEESGVIKRVIYENYSSFDNLLRLYCLKNDFWTEVILDKVSKQYDNYKDFFAGVLKEFYVSVDKNPSFQSIIRWEVSQPDEFIKSRARYRECCCAAELKKNKEFFSKIGVDIEAMYALLISGIYYLVLRKDVSTICNLDMSKSDGQERILGIIDKISELIFSSFDRMEDKRRLILRLLDKGMSISDIAEVAEVDVAFVYSLISKDR